LTEECSTCQEKEERIRKLEELNLKLRNALKLEIGHHEGRKDYLWDTLNGIE